MTIAEAQLANVSVAIAWSFAAILRLLGARAKALWGNIVTSFIVGSTTILSLVATLSTMGGLAERVQRQADTKVWTVSTTPQLWIASVTLATAFFATLLSLRGLHSGQHRFWAAWCLNAPSASLAVVGLLATFFR